MIIVLDKDVTNDDWFGHTINQILDLYIKPFLSMNGQTDFRVALIELFDDSRDPKVKLNKDVLLEIEFNKPTLKPDDVGAIMDLKLEDLENITWTQEGNDGNSAKILVFKYNKDVWVLDFDFRYNQENAQKILDRAFEFFLASNIMFKATEYNANVLIYIVWSTAELILDAVLALNAQRPKNKISHTERIDKLKINSWLFSPDFSSLLIEMSSIKNDARYSKTDFTDVYPKSFFGKQLKVLEVELHEAEKIMVSETKR